MQTIRLSFYFLGEKEITPTCHSNTNRKNKKGTKSNTVICHGKDKSKLAYLSAV